MKAWNLNVGANIGLEHKQELQKAFRMINTMLPSYSRYFGRDPGKSAVMSNHQILQVAGT